MTRTWVEEMIEKGILETEKTKNLPGYFGRETISKVPYITIPTLTMEECKRIQEETKNVLRLSLNRYQYNEVSITYNRFDPVSPVLVTPGSKTDIDLLSNPEVKQLIKVHNENNELVVISLHNHPNNSLFSINDFFVFTENPSIKVMSIVNTEGKVAFLIKPEYEKMDGFVYSHIIYVVPDFVTRFRTFQQNNPNHFVKLADILTVAERQKITKNIKEDLSLYNIIHTTYLGQDTVLQCQAGRYFSKPLLKNDEGLLGDIKNVLKEDDENKDELYQENGEDGYEWF